jgi:hypothetical protein
MGWFYDQVPNVGYSIKPTAEHEGADLFNRESGKSK